MKEKNIKIVKDIPKVANNSFDKPPQSRSPQRIQIQNPIKQDPFAQMGSVQTIKASAPASAPAPEFMGFYTAKNR